MARVKEMGFRRLLNIASVDSYQKLARGEGGNDLIDTSK